VDEAPPEVVDEAPFEIEIPPEVVDVVSPEPATTVIGTLEKM